MDDLVNLKTEKVKEVAYYKNEMVTEMVKNVANYFDMC